MVSTPHYCFGFAWPKILWPMMWSMPWGYRWCEGIDAPTRPRGIDADAIGFFVGRLTVVETRLNMKKRFDVKLARIVAKETYLPFVTVENKFKALAAHGALAET